MKRKGYNEQGMDEHPTDMDFFMMIFGREKNDNTVFHNGLKIPTSPFECPYQQM